MPVLSLDVDPNGIIEKHGLGFISDSVENMLRKIIFCLSNVGEYGSITDQVRQYADKNHSISTMSDNFLNVVLERTC